jgi:hypothetical protein
MKSLTIALSGAEMGVGGVDSRGNLSNIQCKAIQNCHNESFLYNEYILIKMKKQMGLMSYQKQWYSSPPFHFL